MDRHCSLAVRKRHTRATGNQTATSSRLCKPVRPENAHGVATGNSPIVFETFDVGQRHRRQELSTLQQRSDLELELEQLKEVNMIRMKNIAAILALIGSFGAAHASTNLQNDNVQFMEDKNLAEIQGAKSEIQYAAEKIAAFGVAKSKYQYCKSAGTSGCYSKYIKPFHQKWSK